MSIPKSVLLAYAFNDEELVVVPFGSGLINHTWKLIVNSDAFILQKINKTIFTEPQNIATNINIVAKYLKENYPDYLFTVPILTKKGEQMAIDEEGHYYRLFPFVKGSHSNNILENPAQAYEAANQFGRFTHLLNGLNVNGLKITIPHFHDLSFRYDAFLNALKNGNQQRIKESGDLIKTLIGYADIVSQYNKIKKDKAFKLRVTHHDTKISNVLFDKNNCGICVIDLDTIMPGYFISDVGDMLRTYLSPVSEEETDFSKITVRDEFYKAIEKGYLNEMKNELTEAEKGSFFYAGKFMIYMQAVRFLTDHICDDDYYGAQYAGHNYNRAKNQTILLQKLMEKEEVLNAERVVYN